MLQILHLIFVRTAELEEARRSEFDIKKGMWVISAERMKVRLPYRVPLSSQAVKIIRELLYMHRNSDFFFPRYSQLRKPMCKNTMLVTIKRLGYNGRMTGHRFRSHALGLLKEKLGYPHEVAGRQPAHVSKNSIDRAYDCVLFLPQRVKMMLYYADNIDAGFVRVTLGKIALRSDRLSQ